MNKTTTINPKSISTSTGKLFECYPDIVEVDDLCKMLGGISRKLSYRLLAEQEIKSVRIGRRYKIPKVFIYRIPDVLSLNAPLCLSET